MRKEQWTQTGKSRPLKGSSCLAAQEGGHWGRWQSLGEQKMGKDRSGLGDRRVSGSQPLSPGLDSDLGLDVPGMGVRPKG